VPLELLGRLGLVCPAGELVSAVPLRVAAERVHAVIDGLSPGGAAVVSKSQAGK
jgi:hypothetical protein